VEKVYPNFNLLGVAKYKNGNKYEGEFIDAKPNGKGLFNKYIFRSNVLL
jgi:hypothetical protein